MENKNLETEVIKTENLKKAKKSPKQKLLKNQAFLKRGSFSLAITAAVIIGAIVLNILVGALANRFNLEFDMTSDKVNTISEDNIDFIKNKVKDEITITMCATEDDYVGGYMAYYAQQYNVTQSQTDSEYYKQTISLIEKYRDYNRKIKVRFLDTQSTEFADISTKYSNTTLNYGDILVSAKINGTERFRKIGFTDIYELYEDQSYAAYGYTVSSISGNNIETSLTSAISYVISNEDKYIAMLTGHSSKDYTENYKKLLEQNNYNVEVIDDNIINSIDSKYDAVVIVAPNKDFLSNEIVALNNFLNNSGKLDKGLIYFANASNPYLPNFSDFLTEWGIGVEEGILFEPDANNHIPEKNTCLASASSGNDDITSDLNFCITGYNVPLNPLFESKRDITVTSLVETSDTVVAAPIGTKEGWNGHDQYTGKTYSTVIQSVLSDYDNSGDVSVKIQSYVMAFSSTEFINSEYLEYSDVSNKNISLAATERAALAEDTGISFATKQITNESFADKVTESAAGVIKWIFVIIIPISIIATAIFVYIKRRNA